MPMPRQIQLPPCFNTSRNKQPSSKVGRTYHIVEQFGVGMMSLWVYFWIAFALGFITIWFGVPDDIETFVIFESDEELQQACWDGLRKGVQ